MKKLLLAATTLAALASPAHAKPPAFVLFDCLDSYIRHLDDRRSDANTIATAIMGACSSSFALWASIFPAERSRTRPAIAASRLFACSTLARTARRTAPTVATAFPAAAPKI